MMLETNNASVGQPMAYLNAAGLAGLGDMVVNPDTGDVTMDDTSALLVNPDTGDVTLAPVSTPAPAPAPAPASSSIFSFLSPATSAPAATAGTNPTTSSVTSMATGFNAEIAYLENLYRVSTGQAPLPTSVTAPTVNFGLSSSTMQMVGYMGAGLALLYLLKGRKKSK